MGELVVLHPEHGDLVGTYKTRLFVDPLTGRSAHVLQQALDGSCVYLVKGKCSIHDRAPMMCKVFDCRKLATNGTVMERIQRAAAMPGFAALAARGRELLGGQGDE